MPSPATCVDLVGLVRLSGVVEPARLDAYLAGNPDLPDDPAQAVGRLVRDGVLTPFQGRVLLAGKHRGLRLGSYRLLDRIGSGGMGEVFLAEHVGLRRRVAVKVLPPDQAEDPANLERFYREARAAAALDHPHIVRAHDVGSDAGVHFLVLEYVEGVTLEEVAARGGPMPVEQAVGYALQAALGLQHAFEAGLIHRDVKPANLLLDRRGTVKLLDLGLARFTLDSSDHLTRDLDKGAILGTADFIAPEQTVDSSGVDIRADVYSLGATLYRLVTGRPPFAGSVYQRLVAHQTAEPTPLHVVRPGVPPELSAVVAKMMAKNPDDRHQTPAEAADALAVFVSACHAVLPAADEPSGVWAEVAADDGPRTPAPKSSYPKSNGPRSHRPQPAARYAAGTPHRPAALWVAVGVASLALPLAGALAWVASSDAEPKAAKAAPPPARAAESGPAPVKAAEAKYTPPARWPSANPYAVNGSPLWELGQVWPAELRPANFRPLPFDAKGKRWSEGGAAAGVTAGGDVVLSCSGKTPRAATLTFFAPADGRYRAEATVEAQRTEGRGALTLEAARIDRRSGSLTALKTLPLDPGAAHAFAAPPADYKAGQGLTFRFAAGPGTKASLTFQTLTVTRLP